MSDWITYVTVKKEDDPLIGGNDHMYFKVLCDWQDIESSSAARAVNGEREVANTSPQRSQRNTKGQKVKTEADDTPLLAGPKRESCYARQEKGNI